MTRVALAVALLCVTPVSLRAQVPCPSPWKLEETLRIGSADGPDAINEPTNLAIGPDGRIYITQVSTPYVAVFDARGRPAGTIGRAGQGPGEFTQAPGGMWWKSDTLWVTDFPRTNLFTREGKPAGELSFQTPILDDSRLMAGAPLSDGSLLGFRFVWGGPRYYGDPVLPLRRFSRSGAILDTIAMVRMPIPRMVDVPGLTPSRNPFADYDQRNLPVDVTADRSAVILIGEVRTERPAPTLLNLGGVLGKPTGSFELLRVGIRGDTLLKAITPFDPRPVTPAQRQWFDDVFAAVKAGDFLSNSSSARYVNRPSPQEAERRRASARGKLAFPEFLPPVRQIIAGEDGSIWLLREFREDRADLWEIYGATGRLEGSVMISEGLTSHLYPWLPHMKIFRATRDEIWGFGLNELDIPVIRRYRVQRTCR